MTVESNPDPRVLVDRLNDPAFLLDLGGRFVHVNQALASMTGHEAAALTGQSYEPLVSPMDAARVREHFARACRGVTQSYVAHGRQPDGRPYAVQVVNLPWREDGQVRQVIGIARDITEELARPGNLSDSEARYRAVFEHTPDALVLTDPERGTVLDANAGAERLLRLERTRIPGMSKADLLDGENEAARRFFRERQRAGVANGVLPVRRGDGTVVTAEVTSVLYRDPDGRPRAVFIARDLSEERAREAQYRALFEHSLDAVFLTDPDGTIEAANPAAQAMLGLSETEILDRGRAGVVDNSDPALARLLEQRESVGRASGIVRLRRGDGSLFPAEVSTARFEDAEGRPRAFVVARDITGRLEHEAELAASEARYRVLFEQSAQAIFLSDPEGTIYAANRAAQQLFGYSEEELRRIGRDGLVDVNEPAFRAFMAKRSTDDHAVGEIHARRSDGTWILVEINVQGFRDSAGRPRSSVVLRDVTEERRREARLRESEDRFRAVFEHSPDAIFIIEPETGRNIDINPAAEELFRLSREELLRRTREDDVEPDDPEVARFIERRRRKGHARATITMMRGDGTRFPADVTSALYRDSEGRPTASNMIRDVSEHRRLMRELEESREALADLSEIRQVILDALPAHIALLDDQGAVKYVNASWKQFARDNDFHGADAGVGSSYLDVCDRAAGRGVGFAALAAEGIRAILAGSSERFDAEYECHGKGEQRWFREVITPYERRGARGAVVAHLDVTDRLLAERQLELMAAAFRHADEALLICNDRFVILEANDTYLGLTGLAREDALGIRPGFLDIGEQGRAVLQGLERDGQWQGELLQRRADGKMFTSRASVSEISGRDGGSRFLVVNFEDISALRDIERKVDYLSFHDALTGLPNRLAMEQWFTQYVRNGRSETPLSLVYLDLDHFKAINESYGHGTGDRMLGEVADRIKDFCEPHDYAIRLGGDDFILLVSGIHRAEEVTERVGALLSRLAEPYGPAARKMYVTSSAGVAVYPEHGRDLETLLRRADAAHAEIKARGRGQLKIYSAAMHESVERKAIIESHLHDAIRNGELSLNYQPCVNLADGRVLGFEALARWHNPDLGMVSPGQFVPVAEASGFITELGAWVFDTACRELRQWLDAGLVLDAIAVNVSAVQFQDPELPDQIRAALERHGLEGSRLRVEITESVLVIDPERTKRVLDRLREFGIEIAVDDFGTGYSSMSYLRHFPAQAIKLDQAFVKGLPGSRTDASIVNSVLTLARDLGMTLIAEGVETAEQRDYLLERGCDHAQGFFFSLPLRSEDVAWMLEHHPTLPAGEAGEDSS